MNKILLLSLLLAEIYLVMPATIGPQLQESLKTKPTVDVIVTMKEKTDKVLAEVEAKKITNRGDKATAINKGLRELAERTQKDVIAYLDTQKPSGLTYSSLYISNVVSVKKATPEVVQKLATIDSVDSIEEDKKIQLFN